MSKYNEPDLKTAMVQLAATVAGMVGYVEEQIVLTVEGFLENNPQKRQVAQSYTQNLRNLTNETMQRVIETLMQFKPKGPEAKLVVSSWKLASSLERIGVVMYDVAHEIGHINPHKIRFSYGLIKMICDDLLTQTYDMVVCYTSNKTDGIARILEKEKNISILYKSLFKQSIDYIIKNPDVANDVEVLLATIKKLDFLGYYMKEIAAQLTYKASEARK